MASYTPTPRSNDLIQNAMYSLSLSQQKLMLHIFAMIKPSDTELPGTRCRFMNS